MGMVIELGQELAGPLRMKFTDESSVRRRAFECIQCEAILYEDEFMFGKFVPHTLRNYLEHESKDYVKEWLVPASPPPRPEIVVHATSHRKRSSAGSPLGHRRFDHHR
jgi:hypothetical protein